MALQTGQIQETPGAPMRAVYPLVSFGEFEVIVPQAGHFHVPQSIGGLVATGLDWIIGATPVVCGQFFMAGAANGAVVISLSSNGIVVWDEYRRYLLIGNQPCFFGPIHIGGYNMRINVYNDSAVADQVCNGLFTMRAAV